MVVVVVVIGDGAAQLVGLTGIIMMVGEFTY
jgi:hypothetical protein